MKNSLLTAVGIVFVAFALGGCSAANPIVSEWRNPSYSSASFKRIMVGGLGGDTSIRRNFEDEFIVQLRAAGVDALPSYRYISEDDKTDENSLKQAALKAGADGLIFARSVRVEQKTQYEPGYLPWTYFGVFGSHVGASWSGLGGAPIVYRFNEYISEATLYDVVKNEVVWTGTLKMTEPEDVRTAIKAYVEAVIKALDEKNLVRKQY
jgi:hypothetical protein